MDIKDLIPQREPFLFIDKFDQQSEDKMITSYFFQEDLNFFQGHFPGEPIVPGVILSEHCFQSAAALMGLRSNKTESPEKGLTVLSRIQSAKFKNLVLPNTRIETETILIEQIDNAAFFKSIVKNEDNKKVLIIEYACTLIKKI